MGKEPLLAMPDHKEEQPGAREELVPCSWQFLEWDIGQMLYDCRESLTELGREGQVEGKPVW